MSHPEDFSAGRLAKDQSLSISKSWAWPGLGSSPLPLSECSPNANDMVRTLVTSCVKMLNFL